MSRSQEKLSGTPSSSSSPSPAPADRTERLEPTACELRFYGEGMEVRAPESHDELREMVLECCSSRRVLIPSGLGNHAYTGNPPPSPPLVISLRKLRNILRYEPADFTVGVQAGMPLEALREALSMNRQEIPVDFPSRPGGSIGGAVASNRYGPRQGRYGTYRNFLIGMAGMRGDGTVYKSGGMVVKNVAGYDIAKVQVGSLGTLGILLEINLKLRPVPKARDLRVAAFSTAGEAWELARAFSSRRLEPAVLCVADPEAGKTLSRWVADQEWTGWTVTWMFEGNTGAVGALAREGEALLKEARPEAVRSLGEGEAGLVLDRLCTFQEPEDPVEKSSTIFRTAVLPSSARELHESLLKALQEEGCEGGCIADATSGVLLTRAKGSREALRNVLSRTRAVLQRLGGNGRLLFASPEILRAEGHLLVPDPNEGLARRIQKVFDPAGIFHPGRLSRL